MEQNALAGLGKRLKDVRLQKKLRIQQIADDAQVSKGLVSKIENGRTVPSLPVLFSLIKALGQSPADFFQGMTFSSGARYLHQKKNETEKIEKEGAPGYHYELIFNRSFENVVFESVLLTIDANTSREKVTTDAYEYKYMLQGSVEYWIEDACILFEEGDSLFYDGRLPHVPINASNTEARMLVIYLFNNNHNNE